MILKTYKRGLETDEHTQHLLNNIANAREPYLSTYRGIELIVFPKVFFPLPYSSKLKGVTETDIEIYKDKRVLDVGSGTGIRAIVAGLSRAREVVAIDINENAVRNTQANIELYNLNSRVKVIQSDLFENVTGKFDCIIAYLPIIPHKITEDWQLAVFDPDFSIHRRFFLDVHKHMHSNSLIKMVHASKGDVEEFESLIDKSGLCISNKTSSLKFDVLWHFYDLMGR